MKKRENWKEKESRKIIGKWKVRVQDYLIHVKRRLKNARLRCGVGPGEVGNDFECEVRYENVSCRTRK
jgi:hypothetical protein